MELTDLHRGIEAILFAAGEPVEIARLSMALEVDRADIEKAADEIADVLAYDRRGVRVIRLDKAYQMVSQKTAKTQCFSAGSIDYRSLLSACYQGNGGADPRRGFFLLHWRASEQASDRRGWPVKCARQTHSLQNDCRFSPYLWHQQFRGASRY